MLTVTDVGGVGNGTTAFSAMAIVAGIGSQSTAAISLEGVTPTLAYYTGSSVTGNSWTTAAPKALGTYTVLAVFQGSTDYSSASASTTFSITKAVPTLTLSDAGGTYTGSSYPATTASLDGVAPTLAYYSGTSASGTALGGAPATAGTYTVLASYPGSTDYASGSKSVTFTIAPATPRVTVADGGGAYNGAAFAASDRVAGLNGTPVTSLEGVTPSLTYYSGTSVSGTGSSSAPSTVGTYTVLASFAGSTDYGTASASTTFTITKTAPTVTVTDASGPYNGAAFTATTNSLDGIAPTLTYYSGTSASGSALSGAPTAIGTYTVLASFAGSTDFGTGSASTTFSISKGTPALTLIDNSGPYTGAAYTATTASLENVTPSLTYYSGTSVTGTALSGAPTMTGTYTVLASFAGTSDYTSATKSITFTIGLVTPTVLVTDNYGTFNGAAFTASDSVAGGASLENVTPRVSYYSGTSASGTALSGAPTTAGTYTVLASFAGSTDYTSASASTTFSITPATPTVTVTDNSAAFNGAAFAGSANVEGVAPPAAASLENVTPSLTYYSGTSASGTALSGAPTAIGTYTVLASFAGSADYTTASASTTFNIHSGLSPTVTVTDAGGVYNSSAFSATAKVSGNASLEGVTPSVTYFSGTSASGSPLSGARPRPERTACWPASPAAPTTPVRPPVPLSPLPKPHQQR